MKEYYNKAKNPLAASDKTAQPTTPVLVNKEVAQRIIERLVKWCLFYTTFLNYRLIQLNAIILAANNLANNELKYSEAYL